VPGGQLVEKNDAAPLAEGERPGCPAWAKPERPCRLDQGSELARLVSAGRCGKRGVRWAAVWCSLMAVRWPAAAGGERGRDGDRRDGHASRTARPGSSRGSSPRPDPAGVHRALR